MPSVPIAVRVTVCTRASSTRATGGGAKSKIWRQIMADIFNTEVVTLKVTEGAVKSYLHQGRARLRSVVASGEEVHSDE